MTPKIVTLLTGISLIFGLLVGVVTSLFALDARVDTKIEKSIHPIADDVKAIRQSLDELLLALIKP